MQKMPLQNKTFLDKVISILQIYCMGYENMKTQHQLSILIFGIDTQGSCRKIREAIESLRFSSFLIGSSPNRTEGKSGGYFLIPDVPTEEDISEYRKYLERSLAQLKEQYKRRTVEARTLKERFNVEVQLLLPFMAEMENLMKGAA